MARWMSGLTLTVAAVLVSGCGPKSDMPEVAPVKGKVTLDGKPMVMARIYFTPEGGGQSSEAVTNASGEYELVYKRDIMGAKIGKHTVRITTYEEPEVTDDGKVVGLSEAAVRQRVQRLVDNGVMQVVAVTDPLELGFSRQAMIGVRATGDLDPVAEALAAMEEVDYVVVVAGSFDLLVEVVAESDEHLITIVSKRIRAIPQVLSTETFVYLDLVKQTFAWGAH